jgi:hypothetical protein
LIVDLLALLSVVCYLSVELIQLLMHLRELVGESTELLVKLSCAQVLLVEVADLAEVAT